MKAPMVNDLSPQEKTLSGLAYLLGLIPALIIWLTGKKKSSFVRFHALQAALYGGFVRVAAIALILVQLLLTPIFLGFSWLMNNLIADLFAPESPLIYLLLSIFLGLIVLIGIGLIAVLMIGLLMINLVAAIFVFTGRDWRYPVICDWVERINRRASVRS